VSRVHLVDMLDFSRIEFNKAISLNTSKKVEIESKYPIVKLGDACNILIGGTPSRTVNEYFQGENLWVSISEMSGEKIYDTKEKITDIAVQKSNVKLIPAGTTLLSFKLSIGKTAIAGRDLYTNEAIAGLIPKNKTELRDDYLFQIFSAKLIDLEKGSFNTFGKSLNSGFLKDSVKIPLPPLAIQQKIVDECQTVDNEVASAKASIAQAKSDIEQIMSGVHRANHSLVKLGEIASKIGSGATPTGGESAYKDSGITLIRSMNVYDSEFNLKGLAFIDEEQAKKLNNVTVEENDILFNITGASVARCCIAPNEYLPARVNQHVAIIRLKSGILAKYVQKVLVSEKSKKVLLHDASGASTREAITKTMLEEFKIPLPTLLEQQTIVTQIEALEAKITQAQMVIDGSKARKEAVLKSYL
jgi:type I restriction enzyme M protein